MAGSNDKMILVGLVVLGLSVYRLGSPYLEETDKMKEEIKSLQAEIDDVHLVAASYGKGWEKKMDKQEKEIEKRFPDLLSSSEILQYFTTDFESKHKGRIWFESFQRIANGHWDMRELGGRKKELPRFERFKIKAEMGQELTLPYLEHMEEYRGLFRADNFNITVPKTGLGINTLIFECQLEFYQTPDQWVPPEKRKKLEEMKKLAESLIEKPIFVSNLPFQEKKVVAGKKHVARDLKVPVFNRIVGGSVIMDEGLYEEGDLVLGWRIVKIEQASSRVVLSHGGTVKEVSVR